MRSKKFAMIVIVDAPNARAARQEVEVTLRRSLPDIHDLEAEQVELTYLSKACEAPHAYKYKTTELRIEADDEQYVLAPGEEPL